VAAAAQPFTFTRGPAGAAKLRRQGSRGQRVVILQCAQVAVSLIVRPHSEYAHRLLLGKDLVDKAVVNIDSSRVGARKVTD